MKKRVLAVILTLIMLFTIMPTALMADWDNGQNGFWTDVNYGSNWKTWRQTAAPKNSNMNLYGCWVVAQSKLLMAAGVAPAGFNPGVFLKWEKQNGYISVSFNQTGKNGSGYAPVAYAKTQGHTMTLSRKSSVKTEKELLALLENNYLIVKVLTGSGGAHYAYVARDESLRDKKIYYYDSWGTSTLTAFKKKLGSRTYGVYDVWAYSAKVSKIETVTPAEIPLGEYEIRDEKGNYLNATKDSDGGNVNTGTAHNKANTTWTVVNSKHGAKVYNVVNKLGGGKRILNIYSNNVSAANFNVTLYKSTGAKNEAFVFESMGDDAYRIHPADNHGVALARLSDGDVKLANNSSNVNQLWYLVDMKTSAVLTETVSAAEPQAEAVLSAAEAEESEEPSEEPSWEPAEMPSSWAIPDVNSANDLDLVPAELNKSYGQAVTRAEFCALAVQLYEAVKGREVTGRMTFVDTSNVNVEKMGALSVVNGVGDGKFAPDRALTREEAAIVLSNLMRALGKPLPEQAASFADNASISSWARTQVGQVQAAEIMGGTGNNMFSPKGSYTREQSIVTMLRLYRQAV